MFSQTALRITIMMFVLACSANAGGKDELQRYFNDTADKVKTATDPVQKREILNESFDAMSNALTMVQGSSTITDGERAGIDRFKASLQEKQDELAGANGYERVSDAQLDDFSDYMVQDMEQATEVITISVVTLLLIIILIVLIVR